MIVNNSFSAKLYPPKCMKSQHPFDNVQFQSFPGEAGLPLRANQALPPVMLNWTAVKTCAKNPNQKSGRHL